jgi:hypothetical protein
MVVAVRQNQAFDSSRPGSQRLLRHLTTLVPMDGGDHAHLSNELVRRASQGGEEVLRKVEMDTHADISRTVLGPINNDGEALRSSRPPQQPRCGEPSATALHLSCCCGSADWGSRSSQRADFSARCSCWRTSRLDSACRPVSDGRRTLTGLSGGSFRLHLGPSHAWKRSPRSSGSEVVSTSNRCSLRRCCLRRRPSN